MTGLVDYLALRPLTGWSISQDTPLANGVWVKTMAQGEAPEFSQWGEALSGRQIRSLRENQHWFVYKFRDERVRPTESQRLAEQKILDATSAFLVLSPAENDGTLMLCQEHDGQWLPVTIHHIPDYHSTRWARMLAHDPVALREASLVSDKIAEVAKQGIIRIVNAVHLLEHGLQSRNIHLRILLWVTGLDALLMATTRDAFTRRLRNFLGADTSVFPGIDVLGQPKYLVSDVADDLYDLRSCIAHGKEIPDRYIQETALLDVHGRPIEGYETSQYRDILEECALLLLSAALRRVFVDELTARTKSEREWRELLEKPLPAGSRWNASIP